LSPWHLPDRQRLARLLERAAGATADPQLLAEAKAIDLEVAELHDRVHFRNRSRR
nr:hypothetical protein [Planctomycetota bacterium]